MRKSVLGLSFLLLSIGSGAGVYAQTADPARLTLEDLWGSPRFLQEGFEMGRWTDDGAVFTSINDSGDLVSLNLETNEQRTLIQGGRLRAGDVDRVIAIEDYAFAADGSKALLYTDSEEVWRRNTKGFYYVYDVATGALTPLSERSKGFQMFAKFSPDGRHVGFVRNRDLFVVDLSTMQETRLTSNGSEGGIINGTTDWVYEEEFYLSDGWTWSPDSRYIAFVQLDESQVPEFSMAELRGQYPRITSFKYPKAGEPNSEIRVGVADVGKRQVRFFDTGTWQAGGDSLEYIPRFGWTPEVNGTNYVYLFRENRDQTELDLLYGDPITGRVQTVLTERSESGIELDDPFGDLETPLLTYLEDGEHFVWLSERSGYRHLYLYRNDGTFVRQITSGEWDITDFNGVDEESGAVFVTGTLESPQERHLYRVPLLEPNGRNSQAAAAPVKITQRPGWHEINFSEDFRYYIDTYSNAETPSVVTLHRADGTQLRVLEDNSVLISTLAAYRLSEPEFTTVPGADGTMLNAYVIRPSDFDPDKEYPLVLHVYGGPGSQEVQNSWKGVERLWHHYLAEEHDIIVAGVDNRGTGGRGRDFRTTTYGTLGLKEAEDVIAAAQHFGRLPYVDEERLGVWGWSYGGYLTLLSMLAGHGPDVFDTGIAVAPVVDWRLYDTIYTERYLSTPQKNEEGYQMGSALNYAEQLRDDQDLLLVHGAADDNVHFQNTILMADALQAANKQFDLMVYPGRDHSIYGGKTRLHLYTLLTEYLVENLRDGQE